MGQDKALLPFHDQTLLARALATAGAVAGKVLIAGPRQPYAVYGDVVEDVYAGCGPLAGIHAALCATQSDLNLVLSVDVPLMSSGFLRWLIDQARATSHLIVVPDALGGQQPLCAVYRRAVAEVAEQALEDGDYKIGHLFDRLPTRFISELEIRSAGFLPEIFRNVNTMAEYETLVREDALFAARGHEGGHR
jgi:molybdopterin-guanine dinucleotide biosynthesis protein A